MWEMDDTDDKISSTNLRTKKKKEIDMNFRIIKIHIYIHNSLVMHLLVSSVHSGLDGIITLEISLGDVNYSYCHVT